MSIICSLRVFYTHDMDKLEEHKGVLFVVFFYLYNVYLTLKHQETGLNKSCTVIHHRFEYCTVEAEKCQKLEILE